MDKTRILPGEVLVSKGALKMNKTLPELGLKDVSPNGSWLEQKQIQAAVEARKNLIEVERIEKSGVLSHAEWREELMLAEVTQKAGGYWQYLGHNVGKRLFLNPEEALFLIEINCLLLKYNEVKVSLQQAYALMLRSKISLMQYKVYASLSRLGYRVFRHEKQPESETKENENNANVACCSNKKTDIQEIRNNNDSAISVSVEENTLKEIEVTTQDDLITDKKLEGFTFDTIEAVNESISEIEPDKDPKTGSGIDMMIHRPQDDLTTDKKLEEFTETNQTVVHDHRPQDNLTTDRNLEGFTETNQTEVLDQATTSGKQKKAEMKMNKLKNSKYIQYKINKLKNRKLKRKGSSTLHGDYFKNVPEFINNEVVNITAPDRRYLPGKVYLNNSSYYLNVEKIRTKSTAPEEIPTSSSNESMNTTYQSNLSHLRHQPSRPTRGNNWTEYINFRFLSQPFRNYNMWRPQTNLNYFHFNMTFQRPFLYPQFAPRFIMNPFLQPFMAHNFSENVSFNSNNSTRRKKRTRHDLKQEHYNSILRLASYIKHSILELRFTDHSVDKLNHLIQTYNTRYKTRLRLSNDFNVITDENIVDMIEVDDDEDQVAKKAKKEDNPDTFDSKLQRLRQLSYQLKNLEIKNEATSRHRRMFSNLLKRFNNSYDVDYYVNNHYDIINRNDLTLLSSSDSGGATENIPKLNPKKKLKNPFSILKKILEKHTEDDSCAGTSSTNECPFSYSDITIKTFKKDWLPEKSSFGRAEVISKDFGEEIIDIKREEFLFDFLKIQPDKFKNWLDIKISFLQCLQETCELFRYNEGQKHMGLESLVKPEEFNDAGLVLKKLSIFENDKTMNVNSNLAVDFDVYKRDLHNFKKTNRPSPHLRVVCIKESSTLPRAADIANLHSNYKDNIIIVLAVVGIDSISYLQVNPTDLPMYIPSNSNTV